MRLLLHMCCAPCTTYSQKHFRQLGYEVRGFFYNPNIHPFKEYEMRLQTLEKYCRDKDIQLTVENDYNLENYLSLVLDNLDSRCVSCYSLRLNETARQASLAGIPSFSTTLAISPYQNHELLIQKGKEAGHLYNVDFVYEDLRPGYRESVTESRTLGLYRQSYCGCIFSEKERFCK